MFNTCQINQGVRLHYLYDDRFKTVTTAIFIRNILTSESVTKTALVAECLRGGSKKYPSMRTLSAKLEEMWGSAYEVSVLKRGDEQIIYIYLEGLTKTFGEGIDFLKDMFFQNCMDNQRILNRSKERLKLSIEAVKDAKPEFALERMTEILCSDCDASFAIPVMGYLDAVDSLTKESVINHFEEMLKTALIEVFVVGKEPEEAVKKKVSELFTDERKDIKEIEGKIFKSFKDECQTVIEEEGNNQGRLCMAFSIGNNSPKESLIPFLVLNEALGGGSNGRLFKTVREKEGLCYSINSFVFKQKMLLVVQAGIAESAFEKVVKMVEDCANGIKDNLTEDELNEAKISLIKAYEGSNDIPAELINFRLTMLLTDLNMDLKGFVEAVNFVKQEDIKKIAESLKCEIKYFLK